MYSTLKGKPLSLQYRVENTLSTINLRYPQNTNRVENVEKFLIRRELLAL